MHRTASHPAFRPVDTVDLAAACAAVVLPKSWQPRIDQTRLDVRSLLDSIRGYHEQTYRSPSGGPRLPTPLRAIDPVEHVLPRLLAQRYIATRRDFHFLTQSLRGQHPPPFVQRTRPARRESNAHDPLALRSFRVTSIKHPTPDAATIHFEAPAGAIESLLPGQFITIVIDIEGTTYRRAYSVCSPPSDLPRLAVTVKRVPGGVVSNYLNDELRSGDLLRVQGPAGTFFVRPDPEAQRHFVIFAAGTGITPMLAIVGVLLREEPNTKIDLVYGNRDEASILFRAELEEYVRAHGDRLSVRHVLSRPSGSWPGASGRIDEALTASLLDESASADSVFLICGPEGMMSSVRSALEKRGISQDRISQERFVAPRTTKLRAVSSAPQAATFRIGGQQWTLSVPSNRTLLSAGLGAGLPLRYSCAMGGCGACKVKLRRGSVQMDEPNALTSSERVKGYVLACVAHPTEPVEVESE